MSKFDDIANRAADVASQVGHKAVGFASGVGQRASHLGGNLKGSLPDAAVKWVETGAALAAVRSGSRVATRFVRRNPALVVAAAAGAGLVWYAAHRQAKKRAEQAALEAEARRMSREHSEDIEIVE
ncbi:MAG: hypothetical protein Q4G62_06960 [Pseudomonadota bacterium]|nr:hypothetical protein [Pseudomonadota bacterium]